MARGGASSTVEQETPAAPGSCSSGRHCRSDGERQDQRVDPAGEPGRSARPLKRCQSCGRQSTGGVVTGPVSGDPGVAGLLDCRHADGVNLVVVDLAVVSRLLHDDGLGDAVVHLSRQRWTAGVANDQRTSSGDSAQPILR